MSLEQVHISKDEYLKLVSAQLVLNCLKNSLNKYKDLVDQQPIDRKFLNSKRWDCISRPQYKYSCGISSLVSCWNYLFSTLGSGSLKPLTQEDAMKILGYNEPFDEIRFGPFTGNVTLMRWFKKLNAHFRVEGKASMFYKPVGTCKTAGINGKIAKENLETLLHSNDYAFVYHCYNHYCCPIGYEKEPLDHKKIFKTNGNVDFLDWILVADTSKKYQSIHCVKWDDIDKDLNLKSPEYLNIRRAELGVQVKKLKYKAEQSDNSYISTHSSDSSSKFSLTESTTDESEENDVED